MKTGKLAGPLSGVRVLDLTRFVAGPYCTMLLADAGADVIKVEPPGGEETRRLEPYVGAAPESGSSPLSAYFMRFNRNKRSVIVDLKTESGRQAMSALVAASDVLVENYRPGVLAKLGFDADRLLEINPRLVYCSISGFGHSPSPMRDYPAFAIVAESLAGVVCHSRDLPRPIRPGMPLGDLFPAALSFGAICMALFARQTTGEGTHIDMALYDAMVSFNELAIGFSSMTDSEYVIQDRPPYTAPFGLFKAPDGYLCIAVIGERMWPRFCEALGRPELASDPRLQSSYERAQQLDSVLMPIIEEWLADKDRSKAAELLNAAGVPAAAVRDPVEVLTCSQVEAREMLVEVASYAGPRVRVCGNPIRIAGLHERPVLPVPNVGEHSSEVFREVLGYDDAEVAK